MIVVEYWQDNFGWRARVSCASWSTDWVTGERHYTRRGLLRSVHRFLNTMNPVEEVVVQEVITD